MTRGGHRLIWMGHALATAGAWPGRVGAWLLVPMGLLVVATVVGAQLKVGQIATWEVDLPLLGTSLELNDFNDLQWHLMAVIVMLGLSYALRNERHVRVDLVYANLSWRGRVLVDLAGDLIFLLPFCLIIGWLSLGFVNFSYTTGEQSNYGGLVDRYLVKAFLPIGFGLLAVTGIGRILAGVGTLMVGEDPERGDDNA